MTKTLLLIDTHALIHRFFHALPPLTTPQGDPIGAIYGFSVVLMKILRGGDGNEPPDYIAAALDRPEPTFRKREFENYKIQRPKAPDALTSQLRRLPEVFAHFRIKTFSVAGFEADDVIGSLVELFKGRPELRIVILSGDLDTLQLIEGDKVLVNILKTGTSNTVLYDEAAVTARFGLTPRELPDYKGLVGDSSDNIPGVTGIGPKIAQELLQEHKTLEGIYENIGLIPRAEAEKLERERDTAFFSRKLGTISRSVSLPAVALDELSAPHIDASALIPYFRSLGFMSLVKRLEA